MKAQVGTPELLAEALLESDNPSARAFGRLIATGIIQQYTDWLDAERARGSDAEVVMHAIIHASGNFVSVGFNSMNGFEQQEILDILLRITSSCLNESKERAKCQTDQTTH